MKLLYKDIIDKFANSSARLFKCLLICLYWILSILPSNIFASLYKPIKLVSYSDIRLFSGKLYEKLKFKLISQSKPNYWYIIGDKRHYRFNFKKSNLVRDGYDPNKTEKQIMFDRKIYRIYDCGNLRWELTID
jgi:hypothetical protein